MINKFIIFLFSLIAVVSIGYILFIVFQITQFNHSLNKTTYTNPTPNPNSIEYKRVMQSYCDTLSSLGDMDCQDFPNRQDAQETYKNILECFDSDIFNLDADNDGIACEPFP